MSERTDETRRLFHDYAGYFEMKNGDYQLLLDMEHFDEAAIALESVILAKLKKKAHEITENSDHWLYDAPWGGTVDTFVKAVYRALLED